VPKEEEMRVKVIKKIALPHANGGGETVTILPGEEWVDVSDERIFFENAAPIRMEDLLGYNSWIRIISE